MPGARGGLSRAMSGCKHRHDQPHPKMKTHRVVEVRSSNSRGKDKKAFAHLAARGLPRAVEDMVTGSWRLLCLIPFHPSSQPSNAVATRGILLHIEPEGGIRHQMSSAGNGSGGGDGGRRHRSSTTSTNYSFARVSEPFASPSRRRSPHEEGRDLFRSPARSL